MAWTTPKTWVAGELVDAAEMNTHLRDNLEAIDHLNAANWVPTLEAVTTNPTLATDSSAEHDGVKEEIGNHVFGWCTWKFGTTGEDPGSGQYLITLPSTASGLYQVGNQGQAIGAGHIYDSDLNDHYDIEVTLQSTTQARFKYDHQTGQGLILHNAPFTFSANDIVSIWIHYIKA